jgi:Asp-tRNA(Asn)/Glu-tRNA(Gln) amidotransferase C subunit
MRLDYWKVDEKLLLHVARIARLGLTEKEIKNSFLNLLEKLNSKKVIGCSSLSPKHIIIF